MNNAATTTAHIAGLEHLVAAHTEGLAADYDAATDRLIIRWAGMAGPSTAVLRASTATEHDVRDAILRFIYA